MPGSIDVPVPPTETTPVTSQENNGPTNPDKGGERSTSPSETATETPPPDTQGSEIPPSAPDLSREPVIVHYQPSSLTLKTPITREYAESFMDQVGFTLEDAPEVYDEFMKAIKKFKFGNVDHVGFIICMARTLKNYPKLFPGLNRFFPYGFKIETDADNRVSVYIPQGPPPAYAPPDTAATSHEAGKSDTPAAPAPASAQSEPQPGSPPDTSSTSDEAGKSDTPVAPAPASAQSEPQPGSPSSTENLPVPAKTPLLD